MSQYEDDILARWSNPGLKRNSLPQLESSPHGDNNTNTNSDPGPAVGDLSIIDPTDPAVATSTPPSTPLRALARCLGCGQDLVDRYTLSDWNRGLCHRDGTWVCGLPDRPGARA